jgi:hypothetical protein
MGKFSFEIQADTDPAPIVTSGTIADADIPRLMEAYTMAYFPNGVEVSPAIPEVPGKDAVAAIPEVLAADGVTVVTPAIPAIAAVAAIPAVAAVYRAPTGPEVASALVKGLVSGIMANVVSYEHQKAIAAATATVKPMDVQV